MMTFSFLGITFLLLQLLQPSMCSRLLINQKCLNNVCNSIVDYRQQITTIQPPKENAFLKPLLISSENSETPHDDWDRCIAL